MTQSVNFSGLLRSQAPRKASPRENGGRLSGSSLSRGQALLGSAGTEAIQFLNFKIPFILSISRERELMKMRYFSLVLSLLFGLSSQIAAVPKNVILIRHAEKIPKENHLDLKGFERSAALPYYFSYTPLYNHPPISHVFAAALEESDASVRPIQTCTPLANHYKLPLNIDFKPYETKELAQELLTNPKYDNSTVLICWSHGKIRKIVVALGANDPGKWAEDIFDQVYMVTFEDGKKPLLRKELQKLMFGDRSTFSDKEPPLPPATTKRVDEDD